MMINFFKNFELKIVLINNSQIFSYSLTTHHYFSMKAQVLINLAILKNEISTFYSYLGCSCFSFFYWVFLSIVIHGSFDCIFS
jgi:hypothetical protein